MSYKRAGLVAGGLKQAPEMKTTGIGAAGTNFSDHQDDAAQWWRSLAPASKAACE